MNVLLYGHWYNDSPGSFIQDKNLGDYTIKQCAENLFSELGFNCAFDGPNSGVWTRQKAQKVAEQYDVICFAGCGQLIPWDDDTPSGWAWQGDVDISPIIGKK